MGARRKTRNERFGCTWKKSRLHATGNSTLRWIHDQRNDDVLWMDIRYVHCRDCWEVEVSTTVLGSAIAKSASQESQVKINHDCSQITIVSSTFFPCRKIWSGRWSAQAPNVGYRYWTDDLASYIGPKIAPDDRPRITARVKPMTFQIHNDNKI